MSEMRPPDMNEDEDLKDLARSYREASQDEDGARAARRARLLAALPPTPVADPVPVAADQLAWLQTPRWPFALLGFLSAALLVLMLRSQDGVRGLDPSLVKGPVDVKVAEQAEKVAMAPPPEPQKIVPAPPDMKAPPPPFVPIPEVQVTTPSAAPAMEPPTVVAAAPAPMPAAAPVVERQAADAPPPAPAKPAMLPPVHVGTAPTGTVADRAAADSSSEIRPAPARAAAEAAQAQVEARARAAKSAAPPMAAEPPGVAAAPSPRAGLVGGLAAPPKAFAEQRADARADSKLVPTLVALAKSGDLQAAKALRAQGADLEVVDAEGRTALMWAAVRRDRAFVQWLLEQKVSLTQRDRQGLSAADYAGQVGDAEIAKLLTPP